MATKNINWQFLDMMEVDFEPMEAMEQMEELGLPSGMILPRPATIHDDLEYWIANCNFPITKQIVDILDNINGIELLKVVSKHRFVIGLGKMFNLTEVRKDIDKMVCGKTKNQTELDRIENTKVQNKVDELRTTLKTYRHWAIYVLPNGTIDYCASNELDTEFLEKVECFSESQFYSNGVLIHSNEENYD